MKKEIIDYFNKNIEDDEEKYIVIDFFFNTSEKCGKLTYLGFKRLKEHYEFGKIEIELPETINVYNHMTQNFNGFWYYSKSSKILYSTDKKSLQKLKLHGSFKIINKENR